MFPGTSFDPEISTDAVPKLNKIVPAHTTVKVKIKKAPAPVQNQLKIILCFGVFMSQTLPVAPEGSTDSITITRRFEGAPSAQRRPLQKVSTLWDSRPKFRSRYAIC